MTAHELINIIGVRRSGTTTVHGSLVTDLNCGRRDHEVDILCISDDLTGQNSRVMVEGVWPLDTPPGGGEYMTFARRGRFFRTTTIAGADLALHRGRLRDLRGDVNVLVLDPTQDADVARRTVPARAYWIQNHLGLPAGDALLESLKQHFQLTAEELTRTRPKFMSRVAKLNQSQARWGHDASQDGFSERYPIVGINGRDAKPFWIDLEDIVLGECRKVTYELHLLGAVLTGAKNLIVTFNRVEWLATLPGVHFDYLALAQKIVTPRPGVIYVAEKYVDYRLSNESEAIEKLEGFSNVGSKLLWEAITTHVDTLSDRRTAVLPTPQLPRWVFVALAVALPFLVLVLGGLGGLTALLIALGVLALVVAEGVLIVRSTTRTPIEALALAVPVETEPKPVTAAPPADAPPTPTTAKATPIIPPAIAKRSAPLAEQNGHVCAHD